jgi:hypothetical protein
VKHAAGWEIMRDINALADNRHTHVAQDIIEVTSDLLRDKRIIGCHAWQPDTRKQCDNCHERECGPIFVSMVHFRFPMLSAVSLK